MAPSGGEMRHAVHGYRDCRRGPRRLDRRRDARPHLPCVLIDPHRDHPPDFRVAKISGRAQLGRFARTGIAESVLRRATFRSLLVIVLVIIVAVVVIDLTAAVRLVNLVVPQLAIDAVPGKQLGMRAALDRPASRDDDDLVHFDN
jgi:hypothetical protein